MAESTSPKTVKLPTSVKFELFTGKPPIEFKFTIDTTLELEEAAGMGVEMLRLRGQHVRAVVLLLTYALKDADRSMTESRARKILQRFINAGGNVTELSKALVEALNESGVYGNSAQLTATDDAPKDEAGEDESEEELDPLEKTPEEQPAEN